MKYTNEQRLKIADAFRAAKKRLAKGPGGTKATHICWALGDASEACEISWTAFINAKRIIEQRLAPYSAVSGWLVANVKSDISFKDLQQYRHLWLDALIKEFSQ